MTKIPSYVVLSYSHKPQPWAKWTIMDSSSSSPKTIVLRIPCWSNPKIRTNQALWKSSMTMSLYSIWSGVSTLRFDSWPCTNLLPAHISTAETRVQSNDLHWQIKSQVKIESLQKPWSAKTNSLNRCSRSHSMAQIKIQSTSRVRVACQKPCSRTYCHRTRSKSLAQSSCQINAASNNLTKANHSYQGATATTLSCPIIGKR